MQKAVIKYMKLAYYPGCTLRTKAKDLDKYARSSAAALGIELCEIPDWQCCGGVYTTGRDEIATKLSSVRALASAKKMGSESLVTVCSACYNVLKQTNNAIATDPDMARAVHNYMSDEEPYNGEIPVIHYLELLRDTVGFDKIAKAVAANENNPYKGKKIGAYYGCLLLRPASVMKMDDPENPVIMENFIKALGAEPVVFPYRNECCGGYIALEDPASAKAKSQAVVRNAASFDVEMLVTACPLCRYNLEKNGSALPVVYFTELLARALGVAEEA